MFSDALSIHDGLQISRRLPLPARLSERTSTVELATLVSIGMVTALATAFVKFNLRIPGHSIILTVFPMALGLGLVPRRMAGSLMGATALATTAALMLTGFAGIGAGAMTSLCLTGVLMDLALLGARQGWRLYLAFVLAGLGANVAALLARAATKLAHLEPGIRPLLEWWDVSIFTYPIFGAAAGLISALTWFHFSGGDQPGARGEKPA